MESESDENRADGYEVVSGPRATGNFDSRGELDDYISNEPYVVEEVWEKIEIEPINVVIANSLDK